MYLAMAFSACWRDCQATGQINSGLMVLKNVRRIRKQSSGLFSRRKTIEVSWQFPRPLIRCRQEIACNRLQGDQDAAFAEQRLIVDRAVLRSAVGMMDQHRCRVASHQSTAQGFDREIALQTITRGPTDVEPWCATGSSTMARA